MALVAVVCVEEKHIYKVLRINLQRQGWIVFQASNGLEALEHVRKEGASFLIMDTKGILPSTRIQMEVELRKDPGEDSVKVINLDVTSPQPPAIFGNPKGPLPPAVAVRPLDWLGRTLRL